MDNQLNLTTKIGKNITKDLVDYCQSHKLESFTIVTDQNEYEVLGKKVETELGKIATCIKTIVLHGEPVSANDKYLIEIFTPLDDHPTTFISVGSGTITDMTRYVAYRAGSSFISLPTAPSMDGYASSGSSLTLNGMKQTIISKPPIAIFADLDVLSQAPRPMIASGFGDVLGKFTALADWSLGRLIWNDDYSEEIAARTRACLMRVVSLIDNLEEKWEEAIQALMESLIDVGISMLMTGNSRPASGSEHSCSHFLEMKFMREGRPMSFHGTKVGFTTTMIAERYQVLRSISQKNAEKYLEKTPQPEKDQEISIIKKVYGPIAGQVLKTQAAFLNQTPGEYQAIKERIIQNWTEIQSIASSVPTPEQLKDLLVKVGLPTDPKELHLSGQDLNEAILYGHYLRNPFTIIKLFRMMGINQ